MKLIRYPLASGEEGFDTVRFTLYDDANRLLQRIDGRDQVTDYTYNDPGGRLTAVSCPATSSQNLAASGAVIASTTLGAHGLLSRGSTQHQFDPLGDAVLLLEGTGAITAHQLHDAWGNPLIAAAGPHGYRAVAKPSAASLSVRVRDTSRRR
ncbi:MAG: RHS repeat protein [Armatimonadetes bacterium]|nr:RHS repeat protein [Armatimonadota bacterium]